jgi:hypothetical protein
VLKQLRTDGGVVDWIEGLAFVAQGPWEQIAVECRRKVEAFDRDVRRTETASQSAPKEPKEPKPKKTEEPEAPTSEHQWPDLPNLRSLTKPVLLAGGLIIPEKVRSIKERFGIKVEWHEIDHDNPRASTQLVSRVRAGKVGAVILLEGVMRHSTFKPVTAACSNMGVPYAMGDKAGIASLQSAFAELERQLTS